MISEKPFTGPVDSWLTSFGEWAVESADYRCGEYSHRAVVCCALLLCCAVL